MYTCAHTLYSRANTLGAYEARRLFSSFMLSRTLRIRMYTLRRMHGRIQLESHYGDKRRVTNLNYRGMRVQASAGCNFSEILALSLANSDDFVVIILERFLLSPSKSLPISLTRRVSTASHSPSLADVCTAMCINDASAHDVMICDSSIARPEIFFY